MRPRNESESTPDLRFQAFAIAWALWTIARYAAVAGQYFKQGHPSWFLFIPAVMLGGMVLSRPDSVVRLALLMFFTLTVCLFELPFKANQQALGMLVCLVGLIGIVHSFLRVDDPESRRRHAFEVFAPSIRILVVIVYFWAFIHKLNWDYFAEDGCAFYFYDLILERYGLKNLVGMVGVSLPPESAIFLVVSIVILLWEGALPVLLLFTRTRRLGLLLMLVLHALFMAVPDNFVGAFSATMWAMAACFVPNSTWLHLRKALGESRFRIRPPSVPAWFVMSSILYGGTLLITWAFPAIIRHLPNISSAFIIALWIPVAITMFVAIAKTPSATWKRQHGRADWIPISLKWTLVFPLLGLMLGAMPYTDMRNESGFAMFSNMRSDPDRSNHFFIPRFSVMNDGEDGGVRILETEDERLRFFVGEGRRRYPSRLTWFELRRLVGGVPGDISLTYQRDGGDMISVTRELDPEDAVFQPPGFFESRLRIFNTIPDDDQMCPCRH